MREIEVYLYFRVNQKSMNLTAINYPLMESNNLWLICGNLRLTI